MGHGRAGARPLFLNVVIATMVPVPEDQREGNESLQPQKTATHPCDGLRPRVPDAECRELTPRFGRFCANPGKRDEAPPAKFNSSMKGQAIPVHITAGKIRGGEGAAAALHS